MKMKMLNLPEQGYTPANYAKLVELTKLSNVAFCELFNIPKGTFEKHGAGTTKQSHVRKVQEHLANAERHIYEAILELV